MNPEQEQLSVPSLTPEQVQVLINYANDQLPTKYGNEVLAFIKKIAEEAAKKESAN
jgi:hypothetical protein